MKRIIFLVVFLLSSFFCFGEQLQKTKEGYYYESVMGFDWIASENENTVVVYSDKTYYKIYYHIYYLDNERKAIEKTLQRIIDIYEESPLRMTDIVEQENVIRPGVIKDYYSFDDSIELHINVRFNDKNSKS